MVRRCAVPDCPATDLTALSHRFPTKPHVAIKWQESLDLTHIPLSELSQKYVVCTQHFALTDYRNELSKNLNTTAIPVRFQDYSTFSSPVSTTSQQNAVPKSIESGTTKQLLDANVTEFLSVSSADDQLEEEHIEEYDERIIDQSDSIVFEDESCANEQQAEEHWLDAIQQQAIELSTDVSVTGEQFFEVDIQSISDTGDLSFPDPSKELPDFPDSDFLLEEPPVDDPPDSELSADQFVVVMEVTQENQTQQQDKSMEANVRQEQPLPIQDDQLQLPVQMRVHDDDNLVFSTDMPSDSFTDNFGGYQLQLDDDQPPDDQMTFDFEMENQPESDQQPQVEQQLVASGVSTTQYQMYEPEDEDDVFTDEMRLYNEMSKKSLVQLMVKANGKIRELEERLETIESAHAKVLGSLELFRSVLRP